MNAGSVQLSGFIHAASAFSSASIDSEDAAKSFKVKDLDEGHLTVLYAGVEHDVIDIDAEIAAQLVEGWSLDRLARIELSVLRCGAYELRSMPQIPARAVVSEYAALSDACGCEVGFVNAVLDRMAFNARVFEMGK